MFKFKPSTLTAGVLIWLLALLIAVLAMLNSLT